MPALHTIVLLPLLLASASDVVGQRGNTTARTAAGSQWAQVTIEQRVIIRIPTMPMRGTRSSAMRETPLPPPIPLKEVKGPKCLPLGKIRGAVINVAEGVTMITLQNEQFRTHFGRACRPADFYSGFYIQPNKDGALCAKRDTLHARNGSTCEIEKFSKLVPDVDEDDEDK